MRVATADADTVVGWGDDLLRQTQAGQMDQKQCEASRNLPTYVDEGAHVGPG